MSSQYCSDTNELSFLGKWHFSINLEERLKKFPYFSKNDFQNQRCISADDENPSEFSIQNEQHEGAAESCLFSETCMKDNDETCNDVNTLGDNDTSRMLIETQPIANILSRLQEGLICDDELNLITNDNIFSSSSKVSDLVILNFCESVCSSVLHQTRLIPIVCERFILPKICDQSCDNLPRTFLSAIKRIFEVFPPGACNYIILPLIHEPKLLLKLDPVLSDLEVGTKQIVLKFLLESSLNAVEEYHLPLLLSLLTSSQDAITNVLLIDMLLLSGSNLTKSTKFGKLLVCVTKLIGPLLLTPSRLKLLNVIESHKSFQKKLALKAFQSLEDVAL